MKSWRIHDEAFTDIDGTLAWYEAQREGLAAEFVVDLRATLRELRNAPMLSMADRSAPPEARVRRRSLRRFPYVVFAESETEYVVIAVMHRRRRPGYWSSRL